MAGLAEIGAQHGGSLRMEKKRVPEMIGGILPPMRAYDYFAAGPALPFEGRKGDFSEIASWYLAEASLISYESPNFIRNVMRLSGFEGFRAFENKASEGFVAWGGNEALVFFRGTEVKSLRSVIDVYTDAKFGKVEFLGGIVHKGFRDGLLAIWEREGESRPAYADWAFANGMSEFLLDLKAARPQMCFYFTGHSLGGALATLAARLFPYTTALYTYGSPMVGDSGFTGGCDFPHYRWVNNRDAVTFLPPPELMEKLFKYSYCHFGQEKYLSEDGRLGQAPERPSFVSMMAGDLDKVMEGLSDAFSSLDGLKGLFNKVRGKEAIEEKPIVDTFIDHAPIQYAVKTWNLLC